jgi:hypothetical protein
MDEATEVIVSTQESLAWKPVFDKSFFTISESLGDIYFAKRIFNVENRRD